MLSQSADASEVAGSGTNQDRAAFGSSFNSTDRTGAHWQSVNAVKTLTIPGKNENNSA